MAGTGIALAAEPGQLLRAALAVVQERTEAGVLDRLADAALAVTGAGYAAVAVRGESGQVVRIVAREAVQDVTPGNGDPADERAQAVLAAAAFVGPSDRARGLATDGRRMRIPKNGAVAVDIRSGGRVHATLYVAHLGPGGRIDEAGERALTTLAAFAACAIDGTRPALRRGTRTPGEEPK